ncbi:MAG: hypothetical protein KAI43_03435 [Candidatus Aureabacteria bacterium]|nr:hypothetical protein [Candidatus Auribacterota bacterium]
MRELLRSHGFGNIKFEYLASPSFWIQSLHHYFLDKKYPKWWVRLWVFKNPLLLAFFTFIDLCMIFIGKKTSNMRITAQKIS